MHRPFLIRRVIRLDAVDGAAVDEAAVDELLQDPSIDLDPLSVDTPEVDLEVRKHLKSKHEERGNLQLKPSQIRTLQDCLVNKNNAHNKTHAIFFFRS